MSPFKRAFFYITRKRGKTLLLTLLILVISTLVLCGLASLDAEEQQSSDLRGATGTSFTVERVSSWGNEEKDDQGSGMKHIGAYFKRHGESDRRCQRHQGT